MNDEENKIIEKIEKLIALSGSDNENEAKAAMLKAQELMAKYEIEQDRIDPVRSKFGRIEKEQVSLEETMRTLEEYARTHRSFSFKNLLESKSGKMEIIVNFLAILELMKLGKISISQEHIFDDILIESKMAA